MFYIIKEYFTQSSSDFQSFSNNNAKTLSSLRLFHPALGKTSIGIICVFVKYMLRSLKIM
jgi:hypothetical protein